MLGGWRLKKLIDSMNACLLLKGPKCCVSWTLESSPRYRGGSCAICTGQASISLVNPPFVKYETFHKY